MNATAQLQDVVIAFEKPVQYVFVEDAELIHVGGGVCGTCHF